MKLKRTIFGLAALSLLSTSILACGNTNTESTSAETSAATESQAESSVEIETATETDTEGETGSSSDTADNNSSEEAQAPLEACGLIKHLTIYPTMTGLFICPMIFIPKSRVQTLVGTGA